MRSSVGVIIVALATLESGTARAFAATVNPSADTCVSSAQPDGNFGAAGALEVSPAGLPRGQFQSLLRFDLSSAKAGFDSTFGVGQWQVQSVTLQLNTSNPSPQPMFNSNAAGQFTASWMQNDAWAEGTGTPGGPTTDGVTFNTLPSFLSASDASLGNFNFPGGSSGLNTYTLGLPASFAADISAGGLVSLRILPADSAVSYLFNSGNFPTVSSRPLLTVNAQSLPEPACGISVGASMLLSRRRRRLDS